MGSLVLSLPWLGWTAGWGPGWTLAISAFCQLFPGVLNPVFLIGVVVVRSKLACPYLLFPLIWSGPWGQRAIASQCSLALRDCSSHSSSLAFGISRVLMGDAQACHHVFLLPPVYPWLQSRGLVSYYNVGVQNYSLTHQNDEAHRWSDSVHL